MPSNSAELEAAVRVSPNNIAAAFAKTLGKMVEARAVPRSDWEAIFRKQAMKNPLPRMQMLDGFNKGWIDFANHGANARKGQVRIAQVIATLVGGEKIDGGS
ncbi:hypothetical protein [Bradyrhizobium sp. ARR65]|uniref:hypothetical protein n=1 Tax=Bradyrhizobium sp. ARR65 TaxID=1040989 RepID=UPI0004632561|nr:hypothetical protein [Bradyrhizobium sp. ARR65]